MSNNKISFGFSKIVKKPELIQKAPEKKKNVDLIDCLEGQAILTKHKNVSEKAPLVIPMPGTSNQLLDKLIKITKDRENQNSNEIKQEIKEEDVPDSELTIEELAARELIREAQNRTIKKETKIHTIPLDTIKDEKFVAEGASESTLDDYEAVPISDFGMAMLRGMNWKEGDPIGRNTKKFDGVKMPELRPRGLGLGADVAKPKATVDKSGKELKLIKGAFCKIIQGRHSGQYCEVHGFEDESCKVIVKTTLTKEILYLHEFFLQLVTEEDYRKNSKVLNNAKYEDFKNKEEKVRDRSPKKEKKKKKKKDKDRRRHSSDSESDRERRRRRKHDKERR